MLLSAKKTIMRKLKFPEVFIEVKLDRKLNTLELKRVKEGSQPNHMDDKWVIYFQEPWLYFHRLLTGNCIYKIHIDCQGSNCKANKAFVNGDSAQYNFENEHEAEYVLEIFDLFLNAKIR